MLSGIGGVFSMERTRVEVDHIISSVLEEDGSSFNGWRGIMSMGWRE